MSTDEPTPKDLLSQRRRWGLAVDIGAHEVFGKE